jgi:hypothetical protein
MGDAAGGGAVEGADVGGDGAEDGAAYGAEAAGLAEVGVLELPEVAGGRVAVADMGGALAVGEAFEDAGIGAEEEVGPGVDAEMADGEGEEGEESFVTARALGETLEEGLVDGVGADEVAEF